MYGRVTYELMADIWPTAERNPDLSASLVEFAGIWRDMPKFVFSRTLTQAGWNTTVMHDVVPEQIAALKAQPGGDIVLSGVNLAAMVAASSTRAGRTVTGESMGEPLSRRCDDLSALIRSAV
jgi:dihydrofolate reductase